MLRGIRPRNDTADQFSWAVELFLTNQKYWGLDFANRVVS